MVQVITGYPSQSSAIGQILGESLGEGLGNMLGVHMANKSLQKVLDDPTLKDAPIESRLSALQKALSPHGKRGQNLLAQMMQLEQVSEQQKEKRQAQAQQQAAQQQTQAQQSADSIVMTKLLSGEKPTPQEWAAASPKTQLEALKLQNKPLPGGISAQPVPPDVQSKIGDVLELNKEANADRLALEMDRAGVPRAFSNAYIESRRRADESDLKTFDKASDFESEMLQSYNSYRRDSNTLGQMEQLSKSGKLSLPITATLLEKFGLPLGVLNNPESEQFDKLSQELVKNIQGTYGSRILKVEVDNFMKSIPTLLNSSEGRKRLIDQWKILNEGKKVQYEAYREVLKENPKSLPRDFKLQVLDRADSKLDQLSQKFLEVGAPRREKVQPGTAITPDVVDKYLDLARDDIELAKKLAKEDGYEF
jgi:hypothetical protein